MSKRHLLALAILAGGVVPLAAHAQPQQPTVQPQLLAAGRKVEPIRVAKAKLINGEARRVGDWIPYVKGSTDAPDTPYFDAYEADPTGLPTGFCDGGCSGNGQCPTSPASSRWWFGTAAVNPFTTRDMTVASGAANAQSTRTLFAWSWGPAFATQCYVGLFTAETFNDCTAGPPSSTAEFDGVIYDYGFQTGGGGYFYADNDLTAFPGVFHQMPADGTGAYIFAYANFEDPFTGALTLEVSPGTQPMLWGTGDHETPPDGRVGTQGPVNWDDDNLNGMHDVGECWDYTLNVCPNPLAPMVLFMGEPLTGGGCYANCDGSTQVPFLNVADFGCFLSKFAGGDAYANCDGSTQQPILNVADFGCFLSKFAAGCSAP